MADPRLIVGLDVPSVVQARQIVDELGDAVSFYKIGHQLAFAPEAENGLHLAKQLVAEGCEPKVLRSDISSSFATRVRVQPSAVTGATWRYLLAVMVLM